jgi:hypothetical protein
MFPAEAYTCICSFSVILKPTVRSLRNGRAYVYVNAKRYRIVIKAYMTLRQCDTCMYDSIHVHVRVPVNRLFSIREGIFDGGGGAVTQTNIISAR